jgi:hypothetical protein
MQAYCKFEVEGESEAKMLKPCETLSLIVCACTNAEVFVTLVGAAVEL